MRISNVSPHKIAIAVLLGFALFIAYGAMTMIFTSCKTKENTNYGWQKSDFTFLEDSVKVKHGYTGGFVEIKKDSIEFNDLDY